MKFEGIKVWGWENALIGMRLPMSKDYSDAKSKIDSIFYNDGNIMTVGESDLKVMKNLVKADSTERTGSPNSKFLRMIQVQIAITAPIYWWKEMDTYKIGTVRNSSSTMHKLTSTPITMDCFEMDDFIDVDEPCRTQVWQYIIEDLEDLRKNYNETKDKRYWKELIRFLPESWLQTSVVNLNYETLRNIYAWRKNHKLSEWHSFCDMIETLPLAKELICSEVKMTDDNGRIISESISKESVRNHNVGNSDYSKHNIQPWDIWIEYKLNPFDADIVKRILRHKKGDTRKMDYEKIIHICQERIRQIDSDSDPWKSE